MGKNFRETLNEQLQTPEFKAEWDTLELERQAMWAIMEVDDNRDFATQIRKTSYHPIEYRS